MHGEFLIPIVMFAGGFAMVFGIVYLKTRQNLAMIEKGMNPKEFANRPAPYKNLKWGLLLVGAGLGLLTAFIIVYNSANMNGGDGVPVYFSLIIIGGGLGLVGSFFAEKKELRHHRESNS